MLFTRQKPWYGHTKLRSQAHLAVFQQPQSSWEDFAVPGNAPHAPEDLQAVLARERLPCAQHQPRQSLPSHMPDVPCYSPGTTCRMLHLAQPLQGSPRPLGIRKELLWRRQCLCLLDPRARRWNSISHTWALNPLVYILGKPFLSKTPSSPISNVKKYPNADFLCVWFQNTVPV